LHVAVEDVLDVPLVQLAELLGFGGHLGCSLSSPPVSVSLIALDNRRQERRSAEKYEAAVVGDLDLLAVHVLGGHPPGRGRVGGRGQGPLPAGGAQRGERALRL